MTVRIIVEDNSRIEYIQWVEECFDGLHQVIRFLSPFVFYERSHVASGTVFCFQRTVIFVYYQSLDVIHQCLVALDFCLRTERLVDDEMIISFEGMPVDAGVIVSVARYQLLQVGGRLGQILDVEGHVFDEARSSRLPGSSYGRENTGTDGPVFGVFLRLVRKVNGGVGVEGFQRFFYDGDIGGQLFFAVCFGLCQYGGEAFSRRVIDRCQ